MHDYAVDRLDSCKVIRVFPNASVALLSREIQLIHWSGEGI